MRKLKLTLLTAFLALSAALSSAQGSQAQGFVTWADDVSAVAYTYCAMLGASGSPFGNPLVGPARIKTTGLSADVTEVTAGTNPFALLAVGDMLLVRRSPNYVDRVVITVKANDANVTVSTPVNWSAGYSFSWLDKACGTTVTDGWFQVGVFTTVETQVEWITKNATSLEMQTECAMGAGLPTVVLTDSLTAVVNWSQVVTAGVYDRCRLGIKITGDTGAQVVNAHLSVKH